MSDELPAAPRLSLVPRREAPSPAPKPAEEPPPRPAFPEYHSIHDRLAALERLARLFEHGALTEAEFAAEKAAILHRRGDDAVQRVAATSVRGPSLLGRLLGWKVISVGLVAGVAFSYARQPREMLHFLDEALRLLGI